MSLHPDFSKTVRRIVGDTKASVALTFAFAAIPIVVFVSGTVDYARALRTRSALQTALDSAALIALQSSNATASANFLANASAAGVSFANNTPTYVTNSDGSITATANGSLATGMLSLIGVSSIPVNVTSTAKLIQTRPLTPQSITYQFKYAKGWYYKVVTLYVKQTSASATLPLATWTYQAYNDGAPNNSVAAIPAAVANVPYFWTSTGSQPTDTGIGVTTTAWNSSNAAAIGATLNAANNTITFNNTYYDLYLTMQVANSKCAPGRTVSSQNVAASAADEAYFESIYQKTWSGNLNEDILCGGSASANYSMTVSTNSSSNSHYLYINGVEQPANTAIGLTSAFPCTAATSGQTVTTDYEWEDSNNSTTGTRDFFFSLSTVCATDQWSNPPSVAKLTH